MLKPMGKSSNFKACVCQNWCYSDSGVSVGYGMHLMWACSSLLSSKESRSWGLICTKKMQLKLEIMHGWTFFYIVQKKKSQIFLCLQEGQFTYSHDVSGLTSGDGSMEQNSIDCKWNRKFQFSFSPKPGSICELQQDIKKYVKGFEKDTGKIDIDSRIKQRNSYDLDEYNLLGSQQSLLFDHVFLKNRLDTGSLHLCNGGCFSASFLPFASLI